MEQHYIVISSIKDQPDNVTIISGVIVPKYPGDPMLLLNLLKNTISTDSIKNFGVFISVDEIIIVNITRTF